MYVRSLFFLSLDMIFFPSGRKYRAKRCLVDKEAGWNFFVGWIVCVLILLGVLYLIYSNRNSLTSM